MTQYWTSGQAGGGAQIVGYVPQYAAGASGPMIVGYVPQYAAGAPAYMHHGPVSVAAQQATLMPVPSAMVPAEAAHPSPLGRLPNGGTPVVEHQQPRNVRQYPLGFTELAVAASATVIVTSRPQVIFRGYRLIIPTAGGSGSPGLNFVVVDIRVGKNSQLVQATELPASIFQETSFDIALTLDTAQISQDISLTVRNTDAASAHDFRAVLIGAAIE